ncbi:MAG: hypothetical protein ABJO01_14265 [Parasphingorhabdus sp.]|uniref:hypothetical protein n=1 Tax=Parasphingorhabdus sp. TaxID=2709688 RepID=UPI003297848E
MIARLGAFWMLVLAALALTNTALAKEGDNVEATAGDLRILHLWSTKPDQFIEAWNGPTPPSLPTTTKTERNKPIQQYILYANCKTNEAGDCHLKAALDIYAPDGSRYGDTMVYDALPPTPAGTRNVIRLAPQGLGLRVEDGEQLGAYRLELAITDVNAKVTAKSTVHIDVVEEGAMVAKIPPDFSDVLTTADIEQRVNAGELVSIHIFPTEFGGSDVKENIAYVTPAAARFQKQVIDTLTLYIEDGVVDKMDVVPTYKGDSLVPAVINMKVWSSTGDQKFEPKITVW